MLSANELAAYGALVASLGALVLKVDRWAHSPAGLRKELDDIKRRFDMGNERFSQKMSAVTVKDQQLDAHINSVDKRVTRLEALEEASHNSPRPRSR